MKLARLTIALAFTGAALAFLLRKISLDYGIEFPPFVQVYFYLPAFLLGLVYWSSRYTVARSWPVLACLAVPWLGLLYRTEQAGMAPFVIVTYLTMSVIIAALIVEFGLWRFAAKSFVIANLVALALALYLEYETYSGSYYHVIVRFGYLSPDAHNTNANPNQIGAQFAQAAVIGFILFLYSGRKTKRATETGEAFPAEPNLLAGISPHMALPVEDGDPAPEETSRTEWLGMAGAIILALGCMLTASRGAALGLFAAMGFLLFQGTKTQSLSRLREVVAVGIALVLIGVTVAVAFELTPWQRLVDRVAGSEKAGLTTLSGRLGIWENAVKVWASDVTTITIGTGTGMADIALGAVDQGARFSDEGFLYRDSHSAYIEWLLSFGLFGALPGVWMIVWLWRRAAALDANDGGAARRSLLLLLLVLGLTSVTYRFYAWIVPGSMLLALLEGKAAFVGYHAQDTRFFTGAALPWEDRTAVPTSTAMPSPHISPQPATTRSLPERGRAGSHSQTRGGGR